MFVGGYEYTFIITETFYITFALVCDAPVDLSIPSIVEPSNGMHLNAESDVTVWVKNSGEVEATQFELSYFITDEVTGQRTDTMTETVKEPIAPGDTLVYTFKTKADLSKATTYNITVTAYSPVEGLTDDNSRTKRFVHPAPIQMPYTCTFDEEKDATEWLINDSNGDGRTWNVRTDKGYAEISAGYQQRNNDYLVTANPVEMKAGDYNLEIIYDCSDTREKAVLGVYYGLTSDVNSMTVLKDVHTFTKGSKKKTMPIDFSITEDGCYYFALYSRTSGSRATTYIYKFSVNDGKYVGTPDIEVKSVTLPYSGCLLGDSEKVSVTLANNGNADVASFVLNCYVDDKPYSSHYYETAIPVDGTETVTIGKGVDLSAIGNHTVRVTATDVMPNEGHNPETYTEDNSAEASLVHWEPMEVPLTTDFSDPEQRADWLIGPSWVYDEENTQAMHCIGMTPMISRGVYLRADRNYHLTYRYKSGDPNGYYTYDYHHVVMGPDGTDPTDWEKIVYYYRSETNGEFVTRTIDVNVKEDGLYSIGFMQTISNDNFFISDVSLTEAGPYDLRLEYIDQLPARMPQSQTGSIPASVIVTNRGHETVSGSAIIKINGETAGTSTFTLLEPNQTGTIYVEMATNGLPLGEATVEASIEIDGNDDANTADNTVSTRLTVTEDVYALDQITEETFSNDQYNVLGSNGEKVEAGIPFHFGKEATVSTISIGWKLVDNQDISLNIYKWDGGDEPLFRDSIPLAEEMMPEEVAEVGTTYGIKDYQLSQPVTLPAGDYMVSVGFKGFGLALDYTEQGVAYGIWPDESGSMKYAKRLDTSYGTPVIRLRLAELTGIGMADAGGDEVRVSYDNAGKTVVATSAGSPITDIGIYSASGTAVCSSKAGGHEFTYDASGLAPGIYIAKVSTATESKTCKFVVK